jgi:hypothetical protein
MRGGGYKWRRARLVDLPAGSTQSAAGRVLLDGLFLFIYLFLLHKLVFHLHFLR